MATYTVPATTPPSGGFRVSDSYNTVSLALQKEGVTVDTEAGTARLGGLTGPVQAHWNDNIVRVDGSNYGDRLIGDADGGYLYGGKGSDVLEDGGHDAIGTRLYGGDGNDKFYMYSATGSKADGGEGNDTFTILDDTVKQNITGGNGSDTLIYRDLDDTTSESVVVNVATGTVTAGGVTVASAKGIENAFTESGRDTFYGDTQNNIFKGGDGADRLHGKNGDDGLYGGNGNDYLNGGYGNDVMNGGAGNDFFAAGFDDDTFQFGSLGAGEVDTITIVGRGDTLDFRGGVSSLSQLDIVIDETDPAHKSAIINVDVDGGVYTLIIERLLSTHTLTDELAQHVLVG